LVEADAQRLVEGLRGALREGTAPVLPHQSAAELLNLLSDDEAAMPGVVQPPQSSYSATPTTPVLRATHYSTDIMATDFMIPQWISFCGSHPDSLAPPGPTAERGRSLRRRRLHSDCHGHGGSHGHVHVHGHSHEAEAGSDGEEEPQCEPLEDVAGGDQASTGLECAAASSCGHTHGHVQECSSAELASHLQPQSSCDDHTCCRALGSKRQGAEVRLNAHCDFRGHCVQMKHTFLHIPCNDSDSDSEGGNCVVCRLTRSSSV